MVRMWVAVEEMCVVCVDVTEGGIVVMDVFWRRLCVSMILRKGRFVCSELGKGATSEGGEVSLQSC